MTAMIHKPAVLPVFLLACVIAGGFATTAVFAQDDDEEVSKEELIQSYRELLQERDRLEATRDDPNSSETDRNNALETLEKLKPAIGYMEQEMQRQGVRIVRAKPGEKVKAEEQVTGSTTEKEAGSPCDGYRDFTRPATSAYKLPPSNKQSGAQRRIAELILELEDDLVRVSTQCEDEWDYGKATEWAAAREAIADKLIELEREYALTFAPNYDDSEERQIRDAYENRPEIRQLLYDEPILYKKYTDLKRMVDGNIEKFKLAADAATRLSLMNSIEQVKAARAEWRKVSTRRNQLLADELARIRKAQASQVKRGVKQMKEYHPGSEFTLHSRMDFLAADSSVLKKLLGDRGMEILIRESGRRRRAGR